MAEEKGRTVTPPRALDERSHRGVDGAYVLAVDARGAQPERRRPRQDVARRCLCVVGVLVVQVVLAHVDDRQLPQLREVHRFVQDALAEGAFAKETGDHAIELQVFR